MYFKAEDIFDSVYYTVFNIMGRDEELIFAARMWTSLDADIMYYKFLSKDISLLN